MQMETLKERVEYDFSEYKDNRKSYPQRNNRAKLNYRDLERGMYEEIRQAIWALNNPTFINNNNNNNNENNNIRCCNDDDDDDDDIIILSTDEDEKTNDDNDQFYRRLWCLCNKPWDHSRLMLRCDSCANWYHGDCIGVTKEDAKSLDMNGNQFICPPCQGQNEPDSAMKSARSPDNPIPIKRKCSDDRLPRNNLGIRGNKILSKSISHDESRKRPKMDISFRSNSLTESKVDCIVHGCKNSAKPGWIYCSSACIRLHINDTLQAIQRSKGKNNEEIPTREDIALYDSKSKKLLEKNLVPKIEDLCTWINQHPSYEIMKSSVRKTILLRDNQSTSLSRSLSAAVNTNKSKVSLKSITTNQQTTTKSILNKKTPTQLKKPINKTISNINSIADIRSKVPTALHDKILMRLEKNGEKDFVKEDIRLIVNQIEEEMFHVYGKIDNPYKNKFRSLIANISNMNNNYFYKQILSKDLTAKQIVAMKSDDMLPPEEKEKRKDQFEKEVQRIINAEQQTAEELARRTRIKVTRQDLIHNDTLLPLSTLKEQSSLKEKVDESKNDQSTNTAKETIEIKLTKTTTTESIDEASKPIILTADEKPITKFRSDNQTSSSILSEDITSISSIKNINSNEFSKLESQLAISEQSTPIFLTVDLDNDYIEPESPTGIDALIYDEDEDDDDDDNDLNNINNSSCPSIIHSSNDNTEYVMPYQTIVRDDYNPSKIQNGTLPIYQPISIARSSNQWRGTIHPSDIKIPCQSLHVYGESDYLIENIPEQLIILGRLRLGDLWDYIRDSLTVRDILILTLVSSSMNTNDNELFSKYVDTLDTSGRAAVISKCVSSSSIRDMYILAADTKDCPSNVLSSLFLPITFETKQLFLVIIGLGKRTMKLTNRSNENPSLNKLIYNPIATQDSTAIQDPRLLKTKDPRLNRNNKANENVTLSPSQPPINTQQTSTQYSNEDLHRLIVDSLELIRHSLKSDDIRSIVTSTMEILKANRRDDLCTHFNDNLRMVMIEWQTKQGSTSIVVDDNLIEENMDVDDDQDDKHKKQITTSSTSNKSSEFNDVDYRFLDQDMYHPMTSTTTTTVEDGDHRKQRRKSRFSDRLSIDGNQTVKVKSNIQIDKIFSKEETVKIASSKSVDKHINSSLNSKFRPIINSSESFIPSRNIKDKLTSKPIRFSFSKDSIRRHKTNISLTTTLTDNNDIYESSPKFIEDLIKQVQSYGYQGLSLSNDNWTKQILPITPIRSTAMLNLVMQQQQKTSNRFSSSTNEWRSSSNNNHMTHYYDFDQPQE